MDKKLFEKITKKKEFSNLPKEDVKKAFEIFEKRQVSEEEKIRLTRDLLRRVFSAFMGRKIMTPKSKEAKWFLTKHVSTKERFDFYKELYLKLLKEFNEGSVVDLGAGINGISYEYFKKAGKKVDYLGIEAVGQLVDVTNFYFKTNKISNAKAVHLSLFELEKVKKLIKKQKKPRIGFLFKTVDSLEMLERNYSKKFLKEVVPLFDKFVVSFAMRSLFKKSLFKVRRDWAINFIKENFKVLEDFQLESERYIVFQKK
jgi:hypothetical protein